MSPVMCPARRRGAALVEVIVAVGVCTLVIAALSRMMLGGFSSASRTADYAEATALASGGLEAVRSIAGRDWNLMVNGTYGIGVSGTHYVFSGSSDTFGPYARSVTVADGRRGPSGDLVESGGNADPTTKRVTSVVTWAPAGATNTVSVTLVSYVMDWRAYSSATSSLYSWGSSAPLPPASSAAASSAGVAASSSAGFNPPGGECSSAMALSSGMDAMCMPASMAAEASSSQGGGGIGGPPPPGF